MKLVNWRLVRELLKSVDVALEVMDARDPLSTRSRKFEITAESLGVPILVVLNKADLVPRHLCQGWVSYLERREGLRSVCISARKRLGTRVLRRSIKEITRKTPLSVGVFGVPKVGKSTLINVLKGRHSASTSPYPGLPGYTRRVQIYRIGGDIYLIDTPGIIPPEAVGVDAEIRLHAIDSLSNPVASAVKLIKKIVEHNPKAFFKAYGIDSIEPDKVLRELAVKRGWFYRKDKEPLLIESAKAIIRDYLEGRIPFYARPPRL